MKWKSKCLSDSYNLPFILSQSLRSDSPTRDCCLGLIQSHIVQYDAVTTLDKQYLPSLHSCIFSSFSFHICGYSVDIFGFHSSVRGKFYCLHLCQLCSLYVIGLLVKKRKEC